MLSRIRNPIWRSQKRHAFPTTDLEVYKPGSTSQRIAAWIVSPNTIYVAELLEHDEYEKTLPGRRVADYDVDRFVRWAPDADAPIDMLTDEETAGDRLRKAAEVERRSTNEARSRAANDVTEALALSGALETELQAAREIADQVPVLREALALARDNVDRLQAEVAAHVGGGLWARLRRAIVPR
jgi:hypothetical protein